MLRALVALNLLASGAHFTHNAVFLDSYPGPDWIPGPWLVVGAWLVAAATLLQGYRWHRAGRPGPALLAVGAYCASCFLVFGHYLYGHPRDFDGLTNTLIVSEGVAGFVLLVYFVWVARRAA